MRLAETAWLGPGKQKMFGFGTEPKLSMMAFTTFLLLSADKFNSIFTANAICEEEHFCGVEKKLVVCSWRLPEKCERTIQYIRVHLAGVCGS
jgi:hypothetical protein